MKSLVIIYRFKDYKKYLSAVEKDIAPHERGFRSRLSEALGVQNAFVSKVMNQDKAHFTLEQIMNLAEFLELNAEESAYFIWLAELARAGTKKLQDFFLKQIEGAQARHLDIKNRVGEMKALSEAHQNKFYSHWIYGAAHVLSSIPQYQTIDKMADALRTDPKLLREILIFLVECGLVQSKDNRFVVGSTQLHLTKTSPNIAKHHTNWRLKAVDDSSNPGSDGIHYSTVSSLSEKDFEKLRHDLTETIQNYVDVIRPSVEETACCFNLDLFKLIR